jgi:type IV pilus assembly protein PilQ
MTKTYLKNIKTDAGLQNYDDVETNWWSQMQKIILTLFMAMFSSYAFAASLDSVDYSSLPGDKTQIVLKFSEPVDLPKSFSIDEPARIVLDFAGVTNKVAKKSQYINIGATQRVVAVEAGDRTRLVVNLIKKVPYEIDHDAKMVKLTFC